MSDAEADYFANLETRWHVVYRFFNTSGGLLYVGISVGLPGRLRQHSGDKDWFRDVARVELEHVEGRQAALARELEIIRAEDPLWNRAGKTNEPIRALVCGSRVWHDPAGVRLRLALLPLKSTVVHGGAQGVDLMAGRLAEQLGHRVEVFPADWKTYGKKAGPIRNNLMLDTKPDLVIAFWDGVSKGTKHTIDGATQRGLAVEVYGPGDRDYGKAA